MYRRIIVSYLPIKIFLTKFLIKHCREVTIAQSEKGWTPERGSCAEQDLVAILTILDTVQKL